MYWNIFAQRLISMPTSCVQFPIFTFHFFLWFRPYSTISLNNAVKSTIHMRLRQHNIPFWNSVQSKYQTKSVRNSSEVGRSISKGQTKSGFFRRIWIIQRIRIMLAIDCIHKIFRQIASPFTSGLELI